VAVFIRKFDNDGQVRNLSYGLFIRRSYGNTGGKSTAGGQCRGAHEAGGIALLCAARFVAVAASIRKFDNAGQVRNLSHMCLPKVTSWPLL